MSDKGYVHLLCYDTDFFSTKVCDLKKRSTEKNREVKKKPQQTAAKQQ